MDRLRFCRSSEQLDPVQRLLFDETLDEHVVAIEHALASMRSTAAPRRQPADHALCLPQPQR